MKNSRIFFWPPEHRPQKYDRNQKTFLIFLQFFSVHSKVERERLIWGKDEQNVCSAQKKQNFFTFYIKSF